jgi:hypothetical protein
MHDKEIERVVQLYRSNEMWVFHKWESHMTVQGAQTKGLVPIKDRNGTLLLTEDEILMRTTEYYRELAQDDPENLSSDMSHWKGKAGNEREAIECNLPLEWPEILLAICSMVLGTATGLDGIPVEIYKALLKEECHAELSKHSTEVGDNVYVALPEKNLPKVPMTPMGKCLSRIIHGIWQTGRQLKPWSTAVTVSIHKSKDPTELQNYHSNLHWPSCSSQI